MTNSFREGCARVYCDEKKRTQKHANGTPSDQHLISSQVFPAPPVSFKFNIVSCIQCKKSTLICVIRAPVETIDDLQNKEQLDLYVENCKIKLVNWQGVSFIEQKEPSVRYILRYIRHSRVLHTDSFKVDVKLDS